MASEATSEERLKRAEVEQAKVDRENGKLEYFSAITDEGLVSFSDDLTFSSSSSSSSIHQ